MSELRRDYFTSKMVIVSTKRGIKLGKKERKPLSSNIEVLPNCLYCPGNESKTPPADTALLQKEGALIKLSDEENEPVKDWVVRTFPSNPPVVNTNPEATYSERPLYSEPAYGHHYVVVATPNHAEGFTDMSLNQMSNVLTTVQDKVRWLYSQKKVSYVAVFVNHCEETGSAESHPHLHVLTLPQVPPYIEQEALAVQKSMTDGVDCPMCTVMNVELGGPRQILATDFFLAIAPWASSHSYEFWIFPKKHQTSFLKVTQKEIADLAMILRCTLGGMATVLDNPPFNMVFHISSEKKTTRQIHWHIEVYPHRSMWGGLEKGMGVYINDVSPEQVAEELGTYSRKELARLIGIK